jgi:SecD/SecF fusion protein
MSPVWTFFFGLILLILFGWYVAADLARSKRNLGTALTVLLVAFCLWTANPPDQKIHRGIDLRGGVSFLLQLEAQGEKKITPQLQEQAVEVIRKRVDSLGVSEPVIQPQGADRIKVEIPAVEKDKIEEARQQLQKVAKLEFKLVYPGSDRLLEQIAAGAAIIPPGYEIKTYKDDFQGKPVERKLLVKQKADLGGDHVTRAYAFFGTEGYGVSLTLDSEGGKKFGDLTKQVYDENSQLAIVLDGEVQSAPSCKNGAIYGGTAQITGHFTGPEATALASTLENPLQTPVKIVDTRLVSATLGIDSVKSGITAGVGGLLLVLVFVVLYYRFAGLVAVFGLIVNIVILFGAMAMFGFVLTLPGIAGVILTIGLAVDANVLIYERLREEMASGKSLAASIDSAYDKAFSVIFDANATTLITAGILFWKASGPVKGFAVTLVVGIIASVFSAMIVTRTVFAWALEAGFLKRITMLHIIPTGRNFNFLGKRFLWIGISLAVIVVSIVGFTLRGEKNFGIEFKGGDLLLLEATKQQPTVAQVRDALDPLKLGEIIIEKEHEAALDKDYISIKSAFETSETIKGELVSPDRGKTPSKQLPGAGFEVRQEDKVGRVVGGELARNSFIALGLGMLGILIYVTLRFEFSFAIGALVALLHDVIITVGVFALFGRELSLVMVGAILTIAGYSINDTIVVYDRIREGLHSGRKGNILEIMNASINETLSRTLLTSGCTLLSVAALFFFGGPVLHDFAFAILIGIVVGTYSSIFIASPIVLWWSGRKGSSLQAEVVKPVVPTAKA